ncbi:Hypothetical protein ZOBELLIA_441 [Zobellia galactanivorans]|uniref:Lipoprotein n=2 Tax=Zobellia galactanivorans (strain DSM 12802 / CCUG 47099 / CIP 106680 / NCIMB 13871 / Dsij) TaxID=63186 RepID=G0L0W9_ZOBGA|nr:Hypothetical protein ZOBELLIA_441 [Zobellia galactanivorans]
MKRRQFIESTLVTIIGLCSPPLLASCSKKGNIHLNTLMGKGEKLLQEFPHQGDQYFSFYILEPGDFVHPNIKGDKAYVYCENGKIVGYTITSEKIEEKQKWQEHSKQMYGVGKKIYKNDYGMSQQWQNEKLKITLSSSGNQRENIDDKVFYSEVLSSSNIILAN